MASAFHGRRGRARTEKEIYLLIRPEFRTCYDVTIVDDEHTLLLSERGAQLFSGSAYTAVTSLLGEGRAVDEIVDAARPAVSAIEVYYALERLEKCGVIRESDDSLPPPAAQFWDALGVSPGTAVRALSEARVAIVAIGDIATEPLLRSLTSAGIGVAAEGSVSVVLTDDYLRPELAAFNAARLQDGSPWLLARPVGSLLWIGPLIRPGVTACWTCLAHRLRTQREAERFVQRRKNDSYPRVASNFSIPLTESAAASLIATEVAKWLAGAPSPELENSLLTIDLACLTSERHPVVRRPQCPECGTGRAAPSRTAEPIRLTSRTKKFTSDGGFRSESPEVTLARYSRHVSALTGVVTHLTSESPVDSTAAPLCFAGRNASRIDDSLESLRGRFRSGSGGKGKTAQQAKAGALAEAIERYSGLFDGSEPRFRASFGSIGDAAIHPNDCMLYSAAQYQRHNETPAPRSHRVPAPFDPSAEIEWSPLWSLTEDRVRYLPTAYCYFEYQPREPFGWADSNGCAAGNSLEEAVLQGFLELVERDCVAIWWYNRLTRPAVDLDTFDEPYFATLRRYYRSLNRDLTVLDITGDFGIPAFAAVSRRIDTPAEDLIVGFGCHLDAKLGILRAVTETNQFLPVVINRHTADSPFDTMSDEVLDWLRTATLAEHSYLAPSGATVGAQDYRRFDHDDLKDDVEACVRIAAEHGLETLVLDQTRPDIGLSVVRVVVPGMRHFWQRLGPGRLYDVPVSLGWLPAPLPEAELNPIPVFF
ncbi:MAG: TOMM precursor leader peptide-binding protein [Acidobacteria bacterium]|nr:TOMM precursor leader peptide-binding protein [Acidobacteriota bacterium]MBV9184431.1 TOMM precursor leader peptide-binding protein [Acidobacteriota bacterium]